MDGCRFNDLARSFAEGATSRRRLGGGTIRFNNNQFSGGHPAPLGQGISIDSSGSRSVVYHLAGNQMTGSIISALIIGQAGGAAGTLSGNAGDAAGRTSVTNVQRVASCPMPPAP